MPERMERAGESRIMSRLTVPASLLRAGRQSEPALRLAAAALWTIGALLGVCGCLLPHGSGIYLPGWWALTGLAGVLAAICWWRGVYVSLLAQYVMSVLACAVVTVAILCAHHSQAVFPASSLFVLTTVFTASFYETAPLVVYLVVQFAASGAVLLTSGLPPAVAGWVVMMGAATSAGVSVHVLHRALERTADTDALTGLPNRRAMERIVVRELARAARRGEPLALAVIDLDGFKSVNDRFGHAAGDRLLVEVAASWVGQLRAGDVLGRFGGDEFVLVLPGTSPTEAIGVVQRCREHGHHPFSAGVAGPSPSRDLEDLLRRADAACYRSKHSGRLVTVADPAPVDPAGPGSGPEPTPTAGADAGAGDVVTGDVVTGDGTAGDPGTGDDTAGDDTAGDAVAGDAVAGDALVPGGTAEGDGPPRPAAVVRGGAVDRRYRQGSPRPA